MDDEFGYEDEDDVSIEANISVQLGFLESFTGHLTKSWGQWDGGKLGGNSEFLRSIIL